MNKDCLESTLAETQGRARGANYGNGGERALKFFCSWWCGACSFLLNGVCPITYVHNRTEQIRKFTDTLHRLILAILFWQSTEIVPDLKGILTKVADICTIRKHLNLEQDKLNQCIFVDDLMLFGEASLEQTRTIKNVYSYSAMHLGNPKELSLGLSCNLDNIPASNRRYYRRLYWKSEIASNDVLFQRVINCDTFLHYGCVWLG